MAYSELYCDSKGVDECFIFGDIVGGGEECSRTMYSMRMPRGEMKTRPTLVPFFMTELLKYIIHVSCSMGASGVWISIHSATKSTNTCDLMALCGA
jgi:hypothetical protein